MEVAYLTAGAAGMYCGSCLRDNALVVALRRLGVDATLVPTYTPILTDEPDVSSKRVFFGGLNVYLQQRVPLMRAIPSVLDRWLNQPWLIRRVAGDGAPPNRRLLGQMTLSMLRGADGHQRKEVANLTTWLRQDLRPDLVNFSNILIAGCIPALRQTLDVPIVVTLQGDDLFLESLRPQDRDEALSLIRQLCQQVDAFIVFNRYYADLMSRYLALPPSKIHVVPLGINLADYRCLPARGPAEEAPPTIGYLARLAPEKGLHTLVEAFLLLKQRDRVPGLRLKLAGWLGKQHHDYAQQQFGRLDKAGWRDAYQFLGTVDRAAKLDLLHSVDVLSVPTEYQDPKGLYVLEAMAAGAAAVQPAHGAFPELIASTNGGLLVPPADATALCQTLESLLCDRQRCQSLGQTGRASVFDRHSDEHMARATSEVYRQLVTART